MRVTWFDANSWLWEWGGQRILVDPWLVGPLVFGNAPWFFKGVRQRAADSIPTDIDLILLSQGLPDHAHPPTLEQLDRGIPVVGSPSAAKVVKSLGYSQVTALTPGQSFQLADCIEIRALPGAPLGPQRENAYWLREQAGGTTLYYEPHGFYPTEVDYLAPVDIAINPVVTLSLPLLGPIIQGHETALALAKILRPQVWLQTAAGGSVAYEGLLNSLLQSTGSLAEFREQLTKAELLTQVLEPPPGQAFEVNLGQTATPTV